MLGREIDPQSESGGIQMANWRRQWRKNGLPGLLACLAFGLGALGSTPSAMAQSLTPQLVHFFAQGARFGVRPHEEVRLVNSTSTTLCAMIYVFDQTEDLAEGCGCPLFQGKEVSISLGTDLTSAFQLPSENSNEGELLIFSTPPNNGTSPYANGACDPASAFTSQVGVTAWLEYDSTAQNESASAFTPLAFDQTLATNAPQTLAGHAVDGLPAGICQCG